MFPTIGTLRIRDRQRSRARGFTLAEVAITVLILSILAAASVPRYVNALWRYQAEAAACRVKVDLEYLRRNAKQASASRSVTFQVSDSTYKMAGVTDLNRISRNDYFVSLKASPYSAKLESADCGGDASLTFDGFGKPDSSATIVVRSGPFQKTVMVEATSGRVSMQ